MRFWAINSTLHQNLLVSGDIWRLKFTRPVSTHQPFTCKEWWVLVELKQDRVETTLRTKSSSPSWCKSGGQRSKLPLWSCHGNTVPQHILLKPFVDTLLRKWMLPLGSFFVLALRRSLLLFIAGRVATRHTLDSHCYLKTDKTEECWCLILPWCELDKLNSWVTETSSL